MTVVIADEHRAMVEHRYVPVEAATSGIALTQAVHVVGLRQYFGVRPLGDGIVGPRLFAVGNECEQPDVGADTPHRKHCLGRPKVEPGGHATDERVVASFAQAFDDPRAPFLHDLLHFGGIAPFGRPRHLADSVALKQTVRCGSTGNGKVKRRGVMGVKFIVQQAAKKGVRQK